jgi:hypothetical protein
MALITAFERKPRDRLILHPTRVSATVFVKDVDGKKLLQIDTHGSENREIPGNVSQTIQLDEAAAGQLLKILKDVFEN